MAQVEPRWWDLAISRHADLDGCGEDNMAIRLDADEVEITWASKGDGTWMRNERHGATEGDLVLKVSEEVIEEVTELLTGEIRHYEDAKRKYREQLLEEHRRSLDEHRNSDSEEGDR